MLATSITIIAVVAFLILVNGIYVAAEFATVSSRRPRLAQLADEGSAPARYMLQVTESPHALDTYIAACQLGITVSSLVLGFYGQSQIIKLFEPQFARLDDVTQVAVRSGAATAILFGLTTLQVVLGELMPKNVGIQFPERLAMATMPVMKWSVILYHPLIVFFNGSGRILLRLMGRPAVAEHAHIHTPEEILILVEESSAGGVLDADERRLLVNTLQLRNLTARKVMIPRTHMFAAAVDRDIEELMETLAQSPYSRLPLYEETIDSIVGVIHVKDLLRAYRSRLLSEAAGQSDPPLSPRDLLHPVLHVPDSASVENVMDTMQRRRINLAIVVDEYGGTAGMITFEDLVEEIIGEFQDEFDQENPPVEFRPNNRLRVRGDVQLHQLNELLDLELPTDEVDTIGGLVFAAIGHVPKPGDVTVIDSLPVRVDRVAHNSIAAVSFPLTATQAARLKQMAGDQ